MIDSKHLATRLCRASHADGTRPADPAHDRNTSGEKTKTVDGADREIMAARVAMLARFLERGRAR